MNEELEIGSAEEFGNLSHYYKIEKSQIEDMVYH